MDDPESMKLTDEELERIAMWKDGDFDNQILDELTNEDRLQIQDWSDADFLASAVPEVDPCR